MPSYKVIRKKPSYDDDNNMNELCNDTVDRAVSTRMAERAGRSVMPAWTYKHTYFK